MTQAIRTVRAFAVYLWILGLLLLLIPNPFLGVFGMPEAREVWIRVVGVLVINIGVYYWFGADGGRGFLAATSYARFFVLLAFIGLVLAGLAPPLLIAFGAVDAAGGLWTLLALQRSR